MGKKLEQYGDTSICARCCEKATQLLQLGVVYLQNQNFDQLNLNPGKEELCAGSSLHRGYHHPSPIYDIIVGNAKRGRLLAPSSKAAKYSHRYIYSLDGMLRCAETVFGNRTAYIEYFFYEAGKRIGITLDCYGYLSAVSEEIFENHRIACYYRVNCSFDVKEYICYNHHAERYYYDADGIAECDIIDWSLQSGNPICEHYIFERTGGYLSAYINAASQNRYPIRTKRKA